MAEELKIYQPGEIVAADWVTKRDEIVAAAAEIVTVADNDDFEAATAAIAKLAKHRKELDAARKAITGRLDDVKKEIMAQERTLAGSIEAEYNRLRAAAGDYATRLERERAEAERARREAEAEAAMKAEAEAAAQVDNAERARSLFGADAVAAAAVPVAPVMPVVPDRAYAAGGRKQVVTYDFEVIDATLLDRKFLSVDEKKIRAFLQYAKAQGIDAEAITEPGLKVKKSISIR
ncbi:MAG TPA: hypothetical protein PLE35_00355 [Lentisphaeria bacterium]|nr:hypothetical protein [Lentisphaeria bacterium]